MRTVSKPTKMSDGEWRKHVTTCHPRENLLDHLEGAKRDDRSECGESHAPVSNDSQTAFSIVKLELLELLGDLSDLAPSQAAELEALWSGRPGAELAESG